MFLLSTCSTLILKYKQTLKVYITIFFLLLIINNSIFGLPIFLIWYLDTLYSIYKNNDIRLLICPYKIIISWDQVFLWDGKGKY